jgi:hypothetical protein
VDEERVMEKDREKKIRQIFDDSKRLVGSANQELVFTLKQLN